jgi:TIR domain
MSNDDWDTTGPQSAESGPAGRATVSERISIFISRSGRDARWVREFAQALKAGSRALVLAPAIPVMPGWEGHAKAAISDCAVFIFVSSESSVHSRPCLFELRCAQQLGKVVVRLLLREAREAEGWTVLPGEVAIDVRGLTGAAAAQVIIARFQ